MQAVILAAGRGVRMGELTNDAPKPMLKINGQPILEYTLNSLPAKISEIIFVIGYKGDLIKLYFGDEYKGKKIKYVTQENLNGSAAALHCAREFLQDKFLVLMGDDLYSKSDLEKLIKIDTLAVLAKEISAPERFDVFETDSDGYLLEIVKRPEDDSQCLVNTGAYLLDKKFFDYEMVKIPSGEFGLPQTLATMVGDYRVKVEKASFWQAMGYPEDILKAEKIML